MQDRLKPRAGMAVLLLLAAAFSALAQEAVHEEEELIDIVIEEPEDRDIQVPDTLTMRVRVLALQPPEVGHIRYKYGGWGAPGDRIYGYFFKPKPPPAAELRTGDLDELLDTDTDPMVLEKMKPEPIPRKAREDYPAFELGEWTELTPLREFLPGGATDPRYLQVFCGSGGKLTYDRLPNGGRIYEGASTGLTLEVEFHYEKKLLKSFTIEGPSSAVATVVIPFRELTDGTLPTDDAFLDDLVPLQEWVQRWADAVATQDWAQGPKPKLFAMATNLGGYGEQSHRFGARHADPAIVADEVRILRAMGINGFQGAPWFLVQQAMHRRGMGAPFSRVYSGGAHGYPVPRWREGSRYDDAGCPFRPGVEEATRLSVSNAVAELEGLRGIFMAKGNTVDEIASVINRSQERKGHFAVCPHCRPHFHAYLRAQGLSPADFGNSDWTEVVPVMAWQREDDQPWMTDRRQAMLAYWTRRFNCYTSAQLFTELRKAAREGNARKRAALAAGERDSAWAARPWHYPGALRSNSFLMGGGALDFFDFYRYADNAFIYETSNRDPRVWCWDSYLCDVGRVVTAHPRMGQELFGVYVKPHRGAGIQRGLSAVSRGARYINWYTYGPSYAKGDCWSHKPEIVAQVGRANRLIAGAEEVLYGGEWAVPARIAVVKPWASQIWMQLSNFDAFRTAAWENAKWVYVALTHAHLPVDPIDQVMLREDDLSRYDVIYVNGPNLERAAAERLADWVADGGTLVTMGYGLALDEYNRPLDTLQPVLGLARRADPEMWHSTRPYGATRVCEYGEATRIAEPAAPEAAQVKGEGGAVNGAFALTVGREILHPGPDAQVVARYGDGGAAMVRRRHGRGDVYVIGFFAGLEYAAPLLHARFDMQREFDPARRRFATAPAEARVEPVVDVSEPTVEAVLIRHPDTGRQAVTLMNWAYGITQVRLIQYPRGEKERPVTEHLPAENVSLTIRGAGPVTQARSLALDRTLEVKTDDRGRSVVVLPRLTEGDILLLE